jgi:hypothetical protein
VALHPNGTVPLQPAWLGAFPNPANPTTTLRFTLPEAASVTLEVFDIGGRLVGQPSMAVNGGDRQGRLSHQEWYTAGTLEITFDGSGLASGVYVVRLETSGSSPTGMQSQTTPTTISGKVVVLK